MARAALLGPSSAAEGPKVKEKCPAWRSGGRAEPHLLLQDFVVRTRTETLPAATNKSAQAGIFPPDPAASRSSQDFPPQPRGIFCQGQQGSFRKMLARRTQEGLSGEGAVIPQDTFAESSLRCFD